MKGFVLFLAILQVLLTVIISMISFEKLFKLKKKIKKIVIITCGLLLIVTTWLISKFNDILSERTATELKIERQTSEEKIRSGIDSGLNVTLSKLNNNIEKTSQSVLLAERSVKSLYELQTLTDSSNSLLSFNVKQVGIISLKNNLLFENMTSERKKNLEFAHKSLIQSVNIISSYYANLEYHQLYWKSEVNSEKVKNVVLDILKLLKNESNNQHLLSNPDILPTWNITYKWVNYIFTYCNSYNYNQAIAVEQLRTITHYFTVFFDSYMIDHNETLLFDSTWKSPLGSFDSTLILNLQFK